MAKRKLDDWATSMLNTSETTNSQPPKEEQAKTQTNASETDNTEKPKGIRATFIVDPEHLSKLKGIAFERGCKYKDIISDALAAYISQYEAEHGEVRTPGIK